MKRIVSCFLMLFFLFFTLFVREGICLDSAPQIGKLAPAFELSDVNGRKIALSDYKGKVILINLWATWCIPCKAEMPSLNNLFLDLKNDGLMVLAVSKDESKRDVQSFVKKQKIAFPVLMDKDEEVSFVQYGVINLPTSFLIDRGGIIREKIIGEQEWDAPDMKKKIKILLTKKKVTSKNAEGK